MPVESPSGNSSEPIRRLYLFDIDGTLITSGGAGVTSFSEAVQELCGSLAPLEGINFAGNTDTGIARSVLLAAGMEPSQENIMALLDAYLGKLSDRIHLHQGGLLPGIIPLLEKMNKCPDCVLALLTGNLAAGARVKLSHYGVWHYFGFGAYADDHHVRNELGPVAMTRALEKHGEEFTPDRIYVIGDTPRDIECGKVFGAVTVAVATGHYSREELASHAPDFLFDDFSDVDAVLATIAAEGKSGV
jgi:phosphoglycolate phosphatase-like HAD superfamily hydrolase